MTELMNILIESAHAYVFSVFFILAGSLVVKKTGISFPGTENKYGYTFYSLLFGLLITICLYSLIVSKGITINILLVPLFFLLVKQTGKGMVPSKVSIPYTELLLLTFLSVSILHMLPESEYKQNDSFYYLKIAEALNKTGQENTYHYSSLYSDIFQGAEPYHYFELWCTAFITRITDSFYSSIVIHRYVVHSVFITAIILGLFNLIQIVRNGNIRPWHKQFCWALVFFMPDMLSFLPGLSPFLVSNIEGNLLERPNFRILYALLIPLIAENISANPRLNVTCFWLLVLAVVSFKLAVLVVPAMILMGLYTVFVNKDRRGLTYWWYALAFAACFAAFYLLFGIRRLPSFYAMTMREIVNEVLSHWKFVLYSIAASTFYVLLVAAVFLVFLVKPKRDMPAIVSLLKQNMLLILVGIIGIVAARVLFIKDNAYQFLFVAHIIGFLMIWLIAIYVMRKAPGFKWTIAAFLFTIPLLIKIVVTGPTPDVFKQNGAFVYNGKEYSQQYLDSVTAFFEKNPSVKGAYVADSSFYAHTYYSRRNPNVYFLPVTYIVSKTNNGNIGFCLSDSAAIMTGINNPVHKDYLQSAIQRSLFFQFRKQHPALPLNEARRKFIAGHNISYLIVTAGVTGEFTVTNSKTVYQDKHTGEQFIILKP